MENTLLLLLLFFCHFLADYTPLSNTWMQDAKFYGKPLFPILCHAGVHALLCMIVLLFFGIGLSSIAVLVLFELLSHFFIDLFKARFSQKYTSYQDHGKQNYRILFGFDQFLHAGVIIVIVHYALNL